MTMGLTASWFFSWEVEYVLQGPWLNNRSQAKSGSWISNPWSWVHSGLWVLNLCSLMGGITCSVNSCFYFLMSASYFIIFWFVFFIISFVLPLIGSLVRPLPSLIHSFCLDPTYQVSSESAFGHMLGIRMLVFPRLVFRSKFSLLLLI